MKLVRKRMKFFEAKFANAFVDVETGKVYFDNKSLAEIFGCNLTAVESIVKTAKITRNVITACIDDKNRNIKLYTEKDMYDLINTVIDNEDRFEPMCDAYYLMMYAVARREEDMKVWDEYMKKQENNDKAIDTNRIKKTGLTYCEGEDFHNGELRYVYDLFLYIIKYDIEDYFKLILKLMQSVKESGWEADKAKLFETALVYERNVKLFMNDFCRNVSGSSCMSDFYKEVAAEATEKQQVTYNKFIEKIKEFILSIADDNIKNTEGPEKFEMPKKENYSDISESESTQEEQVTVPRTEELFTAAKIAEMLNISANMVGSVARKNNLKTDEYCIKEGNKYLYNKRAVEIIRNVIENKKGTNNEK